MSSEGNYFRLLADVVFDLDAPEAEGRVIDLRGESAVVAGLAAPVGGRLRIDRDAGPAVAADVVGIERTEVHAALFERATRVRPGARVHFYSAVPVIGVSRSLLGRAIDSLGRPVDGLGPIAGRVPVALSEPRTICSVTPREPLATGLAEALGGVELLRGSHLALAGLEPKTRAGFLARALAAHGGPAVACFVGGAPGEESAFRRELGPARSRTVRVVEPGRPTAARAKAAVRVAEAVARFLARDRGRDALLVVDWRAEGPAPVDEIARVEEVTVLWAGVGPAAPVDLRIDAASVAGPERIAS